MNFLQADAAFIYTLVQLEVQNIVKTHKLLISNPQSTAKISSFTAGLNRIAVVNSTSDVSHILTEDNESEHSNDSDTDLEQEATLEENIQ